jgi:hypothetical protein
VTSGLFSAEELAELATAPGDRALAALDAGRPDDARAIAASAVDAHLPIRDIYTTWNALTLAWVERELPVYCMHCPATNRMVLEQGGPHFLLVEPDLDADGRIRGHCSFHVFKHPGAVPDAMYERVGLPVAEVPEVAAS